MPRTVLEYSAPHYPPWILCLICLLFALPVCSEPGQTSTPTKTPREIIELVAGSYTSGDSRGVYRLFYNTRTQSFSQPTLLTQMKNPSFGALSNDGTLLYFVEEEQEGHVRSFKRNSANASIAQINALSSQGENPCHLSLSPNEQHLAVANYSSGNIAVFKLNDAGALVEDPTVLQHQGHGPNVKRQEGPHAHWAQWDPEAKFLYAVNLGTDQVMAYPFNPSSGHIGTGFTALKTEPGSGPRHMVFHPTDDWVYLINELTNQIVFATRDSDGRLKTVQRISTLPDDFTGPSQAAHIAINNAGTRLYSSNRGHDSIAVFEIANNGKLSVMQHIGTQGHWPRFFLLLDNEMLLFVANERSDSVVAFKVDVQGMISQTGQSVEIAQPTYLGQVTEPARR
jgi:6-phosphogluconolactonase